MRNARHDFRIAPKEPSLEPVETREDWEAEEMAQEGEELGVEQERYADN